MYTIKFTSAYKKSYKRISKRGYDLSLLNDVVDMLRRGVELGTKAMLLVDDVENREFLKKLLESMYEDLPAPRKRK